MRIWWCTREHVSTLLVSLASGEKVRCASHSFRAAIVVFFWPVRRALPTKVMFVLIVAVTFFDNVRVSLKLSKTSCYLSSCRPLSQGSSHPVSDVDDKKAEQKTHKH